MQTLFDQEAKKNQGLPARSHELSAARRVPPAPTSPTTPTPVTFMSRSRPRMKTTPTPSPRIRRYSEGAAPTVFYWPTAPRAAASPSSSKDGKPDATLTITFSRKIRPFTSPDPRYRPDPRRSFSNSPTTAAVKARARVATLLVNDQPGRRGLASPKPYPWPSPSKTPSTSARTAPRPWATTRARSRSLVSSTESTSISCRTNDLETSCKIGSIQFNGSALF